MKNEIKTYDVLSALRHDGKRYGPNIEGMDAVKMTEKQAMPLITLKVLAEPAPAKKEPEDLTPKSDLERQGRILAALRKGVVKTIGSDAAEFNKTGRKALDKALGWKASDEDINGALDLFTSDENK